MSDLIQTWVRPAVQAMSPYRAGDASGMIKLDAMENPYRLPDALTDEWLRTFKSVAINRYPDPVANNLKQVMRKTLGISRDRGLLLGNGSDEIILMLAQAMGGEGRVFMSLEPSFTMYRMIALTNGLDYSGVNLSTGDFSIDHDATLAAINNRQPAVVFIANPNNPTGNTHSLDALRSISQACPGLCIIDEAYAPFTEMQADALLDELDNVLIMRTVSKMGLAGLRLGYLIGSLDWINELEKVRLPYNINVLTQCAAEFMLQHKGVFDDQAKLICQHRQQLYDDLSAAGNIEVWPSEANFLLFRVSGRDGKTVFEALRDQKILVRNFGTDHPGLHNCLRVTVGTAEENRRFLKALDIAPGV